MAQTKKHLGTSRAHFSSKLLPYYAQGLGAVCMESGLRIRCRKINYIGSTTHDPFQHDQVAWK